MVVSTVLLREGSAFHAGHHLGLGLGGAGAIATGAE
jgi:hypothetical protein